MTSNIEQNPNHETFPSDIPEILVESNDSLGVEAVGSASLLEERRKIGLGSEFNSVVVDLPIDGPKMLLVNGEIQLDQEARLKEIEKVNEWLNQGIRDGDESVQQVYLRNLVELDNSEEEKAELASRIETAFRTRDISHLLDQLTVEIVTAGIAERNLIREGLRPELIRQPFYFKDSDGVALSGEGDLDIVISRGDDGGDKFKVIVGSKLGINTIHVPETLPEDTFVPELAEASKDQLRDVVSIPLKKAANNSEPSIGIVEVHLGPIDLLTVISEQERKRAAAKEKAKKKAEQEQSSNYSPARPSPSPGRWSSSH